MERISPTISWRPMMLRRHFARLLLISLGATLLPIGARAQSTSPPTAPLRKPDLADTAAGTYVGDVISDSKGSSKSDVTLTVTRVRKDVVRVSSDYSRLPVIEVALTGAMGKVLQQRGDSVFLLDPKTGHLDVSFMNEVSWAGARR
jgi:hypothetical protein